MAQAIPQDNPSGPPQRVDVEHWLTGLAGPNPACMERLRHAIHWTLRFTRHQAARDQAALLERACSIAQIVAELRLDCTAICAALVYTVFSGHDLKCELLVRDFEAEVADLIAGLAKMELIHSLYTMDQLDGRCGDAESLRKMLLAMASDVRVVLIKLAQRTYEMRTIKYLPVDRQKRLARETMDVFAPLANRLGIWQLKWELEDYAFRCLQGEQYQKIANCLAERRRDRERYIAKFLAALSAALAHAGIEAELSGRPKHIYSIWRKMQHKGTSFKEIFDVRGVRILVRDIHDCYAALGIVHTRWQYIAGEFDDYIATPKGNNYQSLHTAVIGPEEKIIEIQIRTHDMHEQNELGIAAHWHYKEGAAADQGYMQKIAWLRQLLDWKEGPAESGDFLAQLRSELHDDRVYVVTPKGKVIDLPKGATPLDFAYHIHTEIGNRCRGAKINGRIVPLNYQLKTGDQVNIITARAGGPSRDWLNLHLGYAKSRRTLSKIRQYFRQEDLDTNIAAGRAIIERETHRLGLHKLRYNELAERFNFHEVDGFFAALGRGEIKAGHVINSLQLATRDAEDEIRTIGAAPSHRARRVDSSIKVRGVGALLTHLANCCKPVPGDTIRGYITRGRGVTVHRSDCGNLLRHDSQSNERIIDVSWSDSETDTYQVDVLVRAIDRQGLLRDITGIFTDCEINVVSAHTETNRKRHIASMQLTVEIGTLEELQRALSRIDQLANVTEVRRLIQ